MLMILPAQCGQGCQCNSSKDASAASAGPLKTKWPWNDAGYGDKAMGNKEEHDKDAAYAKVFQLHHDEADACLTSSMPRAPRRQQYLADGQSRQQ
jgi:hypothetical protein